PSHRACHSFPTRRSSDLTYGGRTYALERPFFILATQNPIEQSGTFVLPEAQQDRFLLYIRIGYPTAEEEEQILRATTGTARPKIDRKSTRLNSSHVKISY